MILSFLKRIKEVVNFEPTENGGTVNFECSYADTFRKETYTSYVEETIGIKSFNDGVITLSNGESFKVTGDQVEQLEEYIALNGIDSLVVDKLSTLKEVND